MKPPTPVPRIRDYLHILARYWWVIVLATALSVGAGWLARQTAHPQYQASARVFIQTVGSAEVYDAYHGNRTAMAQAISIQELARNPQVAKRTLEQLGLRQTPAELIERITPVVHGAVVDIYVTADSPELARDTVTSLTYNLQALTDEIGDLSKFGTDVVLVDGTSGAWDLRAPLKRYLLLGGVLGLALSVVLVLALGRGRDSLLSEGQVARVIDETRARTGT
jgi:capsular polysaccharide biosynthesis protein